MTLSNISISNMTWKRIPASVSMIFLTREREREREYTLTHIANYFNELVFT
jgi:hypothetical protein